MKSTAFASLLFVLGALGGSASHAAELRFTNAPSVPSVALKDGSTLSVTGEGDVEVECDATDCGLTLQSGDEAPAVTFTAPQSGVEVDGNAVVTLNWVQQRAVACLATSSPVVNGWNNLLVSPSQVSANLQMPGPTELTAYTLNLQCFNSDGGNLPVASRIINVRGGGGTTPPPVGCTGINDPLFQPVDWVKTERTWAQAFTGCTFPTCQQNTAFGGLGPNRYGTIRVDSLAAGFYEFWIGEAQGTTTPGAVVITASNCPGDFRNRVTNGDANTDPSLSPACRPSGGNGTIPYRAMPNPVYSATQCRLDSTRPIYYNLIAADPTNGLTNGENGCSGQVASCGAYIYHAAF